MAKKQKGINPELEKTINELLQQVKRDPTATLTDKMKVIDRALKLEALKQKSDMEDWGSGFSGFADDDDE